MKVLVLALLASTAFAAPSKIEKSSFGKTSAGEQVSTFLCTNKNGYSMRLNTLGATLREMNVPDSKGKVSNLTLSLSTPQAYEKHDAHFGGIIGRYANRIAKGAFVLDGKTYKLATNNGPNHLHGGVRGFDSKVWNAKEIKAPKGVGVEFTYKSVDGEEGYPGNLDVTVSYLLDDANQLTLEYTAKTDKPTVVNLTNHAYWNLGGVGSGDVLGHLLTISADKYLPTDKTSIPTGELRDVKGTAMDFRSPQAIGSRIGELKKDPEGTRGYDHCYAVNGAAGKLRLAAKVREPKSGREMEVWTTEPGIQLYIANFLDGSGKNGGFRQHEAFCLEAQKYPDSPNQAGFPSARLQPGETYRQTLVHKFSASHPAE